MDTKENTTNKKSGFVKWAVILGIVVVLNLFFNYALSLVYSAPKWEEYMPQAQVIEPITTKSDCLAVGGQWTDPDTRYENVAPSGIKTAPAVGYCDPNFTKQKEFSDAQKSYERNVFLILTVLGVLSLVFGSVLSNIILSTGFSWGGVLSLVVASMRYWNDADNILKVFILAVALGALMWIAVKKFGSQD